MGDGDSFAFTIPAGMSFTSGGVQLTDAAGDIRSTQFTVLTGSNWMEGTVIQNALFPASPGTAFFTGLPLGPGTYDVSQLGIDINGSFPSTSDYVFTLNVDSVQGEVPEPSTAGLFAAARRNRVR